MTESARNNSAEKLSRFIVRLFIVVLAFLLLQAGWDHYAPLVLGNNKPLNEGGSSGLAYFRDRRIDRLKPTVTPAADRFSGSSSAKMNPLRSAPSETGTSLTRMR